MSGVSVTIGDLRARLSAQVERLDAWWVSVDGVSEPEMWPLSQVEALLMEDALLSEVLLLHMDDQGLSPAPWVRVTLGSARAADGGVLSPSALAGFAESLSPSSSEAESLTEKDPPPGCLSSLGMLLVAILFIPVAVAGVVTVKIWWDDASKARSTERAVKKGQESRASYNPKSEAMFEARRAVRARMKSPKSAEFLKMLSVADPDDPGVYVVIGVVESLNEFGVPLQADFSVSLRNLGYREWELIDVVISE